jgi:transcriptional regulator GlxA family with amidase domain
MHPKDGTEAEQLVATVLSSLDDCDATGELARRAYRSRSNFYRLFRALIDETPGAMRRRLLLERAAWPLPAHRSHLHSSACAERIPLCGAGFARKRSIDYGPF